MTNALNYLAQEFEVIEPRVLKALKSKSIHGILTSSIRLLDAFGPGTDLTLSEMRIRSINIRLP
jgi:hypothetical protein